MTKKKQYKFKKENVNDFDEYGLESPILLGEEVLTFGEVIDKLNEQEETINELKQRNQRQYERLKQLTDLMQKRDWKTLEQIADGWEKQEELLQKEWLLQY